MAKTEHEIKIRNDEVEWEPRPTLGSADYASPEVWEDEREQIWWGDWVCVGRTEEVPSPATTSSATSPGSRSSSCATTPVSSAASTTCAAIAARSSWTTTAGRRRAQGVRRARTTRGPST